jgi:hypothetical protein
VSSGRDLRVRRTFDGAKGGRETGPYEAGVTEGQALVGPRCGAALRSERGTSHSKLSYAGGTHATASSTRSAGGFAEHSGAPQLRHRVIGWTRRQGPHPRTPTSSGARLDCAISADQHALATWRGPTCAGGAGAVRRATTPGPTRAGAVRRATTPGPTRAGDLARLDAAAAAAELARIRLEPQRYGVQLEATSPARTLCSPPHIAPSAFVSIHLTAPHPSRASAASTWEGSAARRWRSHRARTRVGNPTDRSHLGVGWFGGSASAGGEVAGAQGMLPVGAAALAREPCRILVIVGNRDQRGGPARGEALDDRVTGIGGAVLDDVVRR